MALPKEPRQKMINLMYLVLTALLAMNVSSEILNAFKVVDKSLTNSNANLTAASATLYKSLQEKLDDPKSALQAKEWQPKAEQAHKLADDMNTYLEGLKKELKQEAHLTIVDNKENFKEDDLDAATRLFGDGEHGKKKGPELLAKLEGFKAAMLAIDPQIKAKFESTLPIETDPPTGQDGTKKPFTEGYFHMVPTVAALTILSKFQNNIKNAENQVVTFCHAKIGEVAVHMDQVGVLVGQNSNYLMPGQELVVTAGVGAYSSTTKSSISINGSPINMVDGQGEYKTTVSGSGVHQIEVTGSFIGEDGKPVPIHKSIPYTVGVPGGAAIMLDKMNVFYIGVPNPITISSGSGWDKTTVSMTGGTLSGSGSNRTVMVSTIGKAAINVTADGRTSSFDFRVKEIPNPVFKVGPGGTRMTAGNFKNQSFCRADLENFDFDAKFEVLSATVYFTGTNFAGNVASGTITSNSLAPLSGYMSRCAPGSSVIFDNVKVKGPDGRIRTIQGVGVSLY